MPIRFETADGGRLGDGRRGRGRRRRPRPLDRSGAGAGRLGSDPAGQVRVRSGQVGGLTPLGTGQGLTRAVRGLTPVGQVGSPAAERQRRDQRREEPDDVEVEPVVGGELDRDQDRGGEGRELGEGRGGGARRRRAIARPSAPSSTARCKPVEVGLAPDAERRAAVDLARDRPLVEGREARLDRRVDEQERGGDRRARATKTTAARRGRPSSRSRAGTGSRGRRRRRAGASTSGANLTAAATASRTPRASGRGERRPATRRSAPRPASRWRSRRACTPCTGRPPTRRRGSAPSFRPALARAAARRPRTKRPRAVAKSKPSAAPCAAASSSQAPLQGSAELERQVGEVVGGPVGVAEAVLLGERRPRPRSARRGRAGRRRSPPRSRRR